LLLLAVLGACSAKTQPSAAPGSSSAQSTFARQEIELLTAQAKELMAQDNLPRATFTLEQALVKARALEPAQPKTLAFVLGRLSDALVRLNQLARARALVAEAMTLLTPGDFEDDKRIYQLQMVLAESYRYERQPALAVTHFQQAVAAATRHDAELAGEQVEALSRLASTLDSLNREAEANEARMRAYAIAMRTPTLRGRALSLIGSALFKREGLEALAQRGGFARRRLRDASTPIDISLEDGLSFGPIASVAPTPGVADFSTAPSQPTPPPQSTPVSPTVSNAARVVASMRAGFRTCYQRALTESRDAQGSVRLLLKVGRDGEVVVVQALSLGLPPSCVDCILERALAGQFDPPEGGSAVIAVPVTFVKQ
jgi:tetratricopeptide (TPR) repeat protein